MNAAWPRDDRKCRLCLEEKRGLIYIFEVSGSLKNVAEIISKVLMHEVSHDDKFPPYVCTDCSDKLYEFHEFKQKCDSLRETYKLELMKKEARNVKNGELSQSDVKKEELSDVHLNDPLATSSPFRSPIRFQELDNAVKADNEEVPVGENFPFLVAAFPINAVDDVEKHDLDPLGVPVDSEVFSDRGRYILQEYEQAVKDAPKEEEVDLPLDAIPYIVSALPVKVDNHVGEGEPLDAPKEMEEEERKLRPRKPTNYTLHHLSPRFESSDSDSSNYTLSELEDSASTDESFGRQRNLKVRNKSKVPVYVVPACPQTSKRSLGSNPVQSEAVHQDHTFAKKQLQTLESTKSVIYRRTEAIDKRQGSTIVASKVKRRVKKASSAVLSKVTDTSMSMQDNGLGSVNDSMHFSRPGSEENEKTSESSEEDFEELQEEERQLESTLDYLCHICGKIFHQRPTLYAHLKLHEGKHTFQCDKCPKTFRLKKSMQIHMLAHGDDRPFKCDKCPKRFKCKMHLQQHGISHTGKRKYPCTHCEESFRTRYQFGSHQKKHEGKVLWPCDCGEKFKSWEELEKHQVEHRRNRTYKCEICSKVYKVKSFLMRHLNVHTKPFQCSICNKSFAQTTEVQIHMNLHTGERPYKCKQCESRFINKTTWRKHIQNVHSSFKKFKCSFCDFRTKYKFELKKHQKRRHGNEVD